MKHDYEWVEKLEDRTRRIVRVSFSGDNIVWMCRNEDSEWWKRNMKPTSEQWDFLEKKVRGRYNRRRAGMKDIERVVSMRQDHA